MPFSAKPKKGSHTARWHLSTFALALCLPVIAFVGFLLWQYTSAEQARLEGRATDLATDVSVAVDQDLTGLLGGLEVLSLSRFLVEGDLEGFYAQSKEVEVRQGVMVVLRELNGQQVVNTRVPYPSALPVTPLDVDQQVIATSKAHVTNLFIGGVAKEPLFGVVVPVTIAGQIRYLLSLSLPIARVQNLIGTQDIPPDWTLAIVDRNGTILARNIRQAEFVGKTATPDLLENTKGRRGTWIGTTLDGEFSAPMLEAAFQTGVSPSASGRPH